MCRYQQVPVDGPYWWLYSWRKTYQGNLCAGICHWYEYSGVTPQHPASKSPSLKQNSGGAKLCADSFFWLLILMMGGWLIHKIVCFRNGTIIHLVASLEWTARYSTLHYRVVNPDSYWIHMNTDPDQHIE